MKKEKKGDKPKWSPPVLSQITQAEYEKRILKAKQKDSKNKPRR